MQTVVANYAFSYDLLCWHLNTVCRILHIDLVWTDMHLFVFNLYVLAQREGEQVKALYNKKRCLNIHLNPSARSEDRITIWSWKCWWMLLQFRLINWVKKVGQRDVLPDCAAHMWQGVGRTERGLIHNVNLPWRCVPRKNDESGLFLTASFSLQFVAT